MQFVVPFSDMKLGKKLLISFLIWFG